MEWIDVCGVRVSAINIPLACDIIGSWIKERRKAYVCVAPVSTIVECQENKDYRQIVNGANMVTPDGMPLVWCGKWQGSKVINRTYGADLMLALCDISQKEGYRHYFYGGTDFALQNLETRLKERFPRLVVVGKYAPPFRELTAEEDEQFIAEINRLNPDILWVGLGSPKQDFWMVRHRESLNVPAMVAVGAAFDFLSGVKRQAPRWMQRSGLEWIFRLCCEPRRLWKRYLVGNTKFLYYFLCDCFKKSTAKT